MPLRSCFRAAAAAAAAADAVENAFTVREAPTAGRRTGIIYVRSYVSHAALLRPETRLSEHHEKEIIQATTACENDQPVVMHTSTRASYVAGVAGR